MRAMLRKSDIDTTSLLKNVLPFLIVVTFIGLLLGRIYVPIRLFLIGGLSPARILSVEMDSLSDGENGWIDYVVIKVDRFPGEITSFNTNLKVGQTVTLLSSKRLQTAIVLPDGTDFFSVLYNSGAAAPIGNVILLLLGVCAAFVFRVYTFMHYVVQRISSMWGNIDYYPMGLQQRILAWTDFLSQLTTLAVAVGLVCSIIFLLLQAVFLVEQSGELQAGIVILVAAVFLFSPAAERIVDIIFKIKEQTVLRELLSIVRNVLYILAGCALLFKMFEFIFQKDMKQFSTIQDVMIDFISFLFS